MNAPLMTKGWPELFKYPAPRASSIRNCSDVEFVLAVTGVVLVTDVPVAPPPEEHAEAVARQIAPLPDTAVASAVATPVPRPEMPVLTGSPVALVKVPLVGVPRIGVTKVGEVANTSAPDPVSSVTAEIRLALDGVAKNVATPVPRPLTPVAIGSPVAFVSVPLVGVPRIGVTKVGDVANTSAPLPVSLVTAVARLALLGVARNVAMPVPNPLTPVLIGRPVALVNVPADGVPISGVVNAGDVARTTLPLPVDATNKRA